MTTNDIDSPANVASDAAAKPTWRGLLHHLAAWYALGAGTVLVAMASNRRAAAAAAIYSASLVALFAISAIYHRIQWGERARQFMRRADHASIFLLIAGTYTPIALLGLGGDEGRTLMIMIWSGAAAGVLMSVFWVKAPKPLTAAVAVAVGWTIAPYIGHVKRLLGDQMWLILAGGIAYTVGAIVYAAKRPNPAPRVFGYHEIFHALTILGALLHFAVIVQIVRASGG